MPFKFPVQDEETAAIRKLLQFVKPINARDMWTWIETQTCKELGKKREETKFKPETINVNSMQQL